MIEAEIAGFPRLGAKPGTRGFTAAATPAPILHWFRSEKSLRREWPWLGFRFLSHALFQTALSYIHCTADPCSRHIPVYAVHLHQRFDGDIQQCFGGFEHCFFPSATIKIIYCFLSRTITANFFAIVINDNEPTYGATYSIISFRNFYHKSPSKIWIYQNA